VRTSGTLGIAGLAFAFLLAWLADRSGSAMIVGAFAAGLVLYRLPQRHEIEKAATAIGHFFVPVFFATVGAAVTLELDDGRVQRGGVALTAVGPQNLRAKAAEESLASAEPTETNFEEAAGLAAEAAEPASDLRGSADYKRETVRVFVRRGLGAAHEMATAA